MRAVLCEGTRAFVAEVPDPAPAPDEVIVEVDACGLCGSDVHALQGGQVARGQILGHEFSGRIAALGREVTGWQEGQPVAASPLGSCGKCRTCARGLAFRCEAAPNIGITRQGAYAQYVAVPARQLVALPAGLPVEVGSHAEPLSVALQAVSLARVGPGDPVLVYGVGPIGLYAIIGLRMAGAGPIVAAGRSAGRREAAAAVGADVVLDTRQVPVTAYAEESGTRFAAVLECSASPGAFTEAMTVTEPGGTVVAVALTPEAPPLPLFAMVSEGLHLVGACAFSDETYRVAVGHLASGRAPVERLVSERVTLDQTPQALARLRAPGSLVRVISRPHLSAAPFLAERKDHLSYRKGDRSDGGLRGQDRGHHRGRQRHGQGVRAALGGRGDERRAWRHPAGRAGRGGRRDLGRRRPGGRRADGRVVA